ncbi:MAG: exodeoxyribonuclease VII large subunit [Candidatus Omnitrophota bacterium]|nr:exodeoxyribonuclease VII large subunit [Candidatus Omnitrophota bacterium]
MNKQNAERVYSVVELNTIVRELLRMEFPSYVWVCGEIQDLRDRGTVNLNLVQKHPEREEIVAQAKAVIFENIKPTIIRRIAQTKGAFELKVDIEVKLLCKVDLYVKSGQFSLTVVDIDPVYTLGKMAQSRQRIIEDLRCRGLLERNKRFKIPEVPLRIGLITATDSAAYHDFIDELKKSGYGFSVEARDCYMQGKLLEESVARALTFFNQKPPEELDVILICRGGGSTADLSWFDNKKIAEAVALSHFPVIAALGHQINTTITDLVAHTSVKTPTKSAFVLVERIAGFLETLDTHKEKIIVQSQNMLMRTRATLTTIAVKFDSVLPRFFRVHKDELTRAERDIFSASRAQLAKKHQNLIRQREMLSLYFDRFIKGRRDTLKHTQEKLSLLDPKHVLRRGYSVTTKNGRALKSIDSTAEGDIIKTLLYEGSIDSSVVRLTKEI